MPELSFVFWTLAVCTLIFFVALVVDAFTKTLRKVVLYDFLTGCVYLGIIYAFEMNLVNNIALVAIVIFITFDLVIMVHRIRKWWKKCKKGEV